MTTDLSHPDREAAAATFAELGLCTEILRTLTAAGYTAPTPVQQQAIPAVLTGRDLLVSSPTGSGKTAAFMLPAIQRFCSQKRSELAEQNLRPSHLSTHPTTHLNRNGRASAENGGYTGTNTATNKRTTGIRGRASGGYGHPNHRLPTAPARPALLVLTPTRELAMQVANAASIYGRYLKQLQTMSVFGGVPYRQQLMLLAKQPEIIVATPGRLIDHLEHRRIDLSALQILVLDEADRMLDMGFIDDIEKIVAATPTTRQTLLFSATLDHRIDALTKHLLKSPGRIEIAQRVGQHTNIAQAIHWVDDRAHKDRLLIHLLSDHTLSQALVFTSTKIGAAELAKQLDDAGFTSAALHGDLPQGARNRTIRALREQRVQVLVATDVAARGIDIPGITHVFNYDLPKFAEDYVHRIGRTGRAGRSGTAISLVNHGEVDLVKRIERFTRQTLAIKVIEGFEPKRVPTMTMPRDRSRFSKRKTFNKTNQNDTFRKKPKIFAKARRVIQDNRFSR